jgi:hypothetical protein
MLHKRPHNRFEDLDGCYLVGGGTHPGSGLPVIYSSAQITTRLLLEDLGVEAPEAAASPQPLASAFQQSVAERSVAEDVMTASVTASSHEESTTTPSATAVVETVSAATRNQP